MSYQEALASQFAVEPRFYKKIVVGLAGTIDLAVDCATVHKDKTRRIAERPTIMIRL